MAVRFLLGPAGSGKTHHCLAALRELEKKRAGGIYLVPEQFTYSADRELLATNEIAGTRHVHVLSFTRFAWWLHEQTATPAPQTIDDAVRPMYLRAVLERIDPTDVEAILHLKREHGLLQQLSRFVGEVRNHGSRDFLHNLSSGNTPDDIPEGILAKIRSLAAVYESYAARLRETGWHDPEERLDDVLPLIAGESAKIAEFSFFVDGFLSWTRREAELIVALAKTGASITIALCCDPSEPEESRRLPFGPVWRSYDRLVLDFERAEVPFDPPIHLGTPSYGATPSIREVERRIYAEAEVANESDSTEIDSVVLQPAEDRRQEVIAWARQIDRWIRLDAAPVRPGEIAVLVRDLEPYRELVSRIFPRYGIPYFLDERRSALAHPRCRLVLHALETLLSGWRRSSVVSLLRNPLLEIDPATVDLIENLSLQYGRDFDAWHASEWEDFIPVARTRYLKKDGNDPDPNLYIDPQDAFNEEGEDDEEVADSADLVERVVQTESPALACGLTDDIRRRVLAPLREMQQQWGSEEWTGRDVVHRLAEYARQVLPAARSDRPPRPSSEAEREWEERVTEELAELLREMGEIWADVPVTIEEFTRTLREGLRALRIGITPIRLDQVVVGDVQRSRLQGIRNSIVGGVNEGVFPRAIHDDPILNERDRDALSRLGLPLGPTAVERQEEEAYLFYIALTRATDNLVVTWSGRDETGDALSPSLLLSELRSQMPGLDVEPNFVEQETREHVERVQSRSELTAAVLSRLTDLVHGRTVDANLPGDTKSPVGSNSSVDSNLPVDAKSTADSNLPVDANSPLNANVWFDVYETVRVSTDVAVQPLREELATAIPGLLYRPEAHLPTSLRALCFPTDVIESSVSRLSEFVSCPYQNFARSILRLEPRPEARITPLETGSLAHDVLDLFFRDLDPQRFRESSIEDRLVEVFDQLEDRSEYRAFAVDPSSAYRWKSTRFALERFLRIELDRLSRSPFQIEAQELPFGFGDHAALELSLPEGRSLALRGQIDRVDLAPPREPDGRPRALVIDYKRTRRSGLPRSLEEGLDLQLGAYLLYLDRVQNYEPVAGIYLPVLPSPPRTEKMKDRDANAIDLKAHGIVLASERAEVDARSDILVAPRGKRGQIVPEKEGMDRALETTERYLTTYAHNLQSGWIEPRPLQTDAARMPCDHCDFNAVCRFQPASGPRRHRATEGMLRCTEPVPSSQEETVDSEVAGKR